MKDRTAPTTTASRDNQARQRLAALIRELAPPAAAGPPPVPTPRPKPTHQLDPDDHLARTAPPPGAATAPEPVAPPDEPPHLADPPHHQHVLDDPLDWLLDDPTEPDGRVADPPPSMSTAALRAQLAGPAWANGRAGRLVERWVPGGARGVDGLRGLAGRHRIGTAAVLLTVVAGILTAVVAGAARPAPEAPPPLPAAVSSALVTSTSATAPSRVVVSVVGRVVDPGLVTVANGARVDDALRAAGGVSPGAELGALNLARRLADGEQLYVGIPIPAGAADPAANNADPAGQDQAAPAASGDPAPPVTTGGKGKGKGKKGAGTGARVNLNTATAEELQTLPGVGPAMAQRILTWRGLHGRFDTVNQLHDVGGIGVARFAKLQNLVTT